MSFLADLTMGGVSGLLSGVGTLVKDIKQVITGEINPDIRAELDSKLAELTFALQLAHDQYDSDVIKNQGAIILAEARNESWLTRNWRPLLMINIIIIIANNYIISPYLSLFNLHVLTLELPDKLWNLMTLGVSGYVAGRSIEKGVKMWKEK